MPRKPCISCVTAGMCELQGLSRVGCWWMAGAEPKLLVAELIHRTGLPFQGWLGIDLTISRSTGAGWLAGIPRTQRQGWHASGQAKVSGSGYHTGCAAKRALAWPPAPSVPSTNVRRRSSAKKPSTCSRYKSVPQSQRLICNQRTVTSLQTLCAACVRGCVCVSSSMYVATVKRRGTCLVTSRSSTGV